MRRIKTYHKQQKNSNLVQVKQINILIVGRTRTGKSTIKATLLDPTSVTKEENILSDTRDPSFESFVIQDLGIVLNIIDTPGVFEYTDQASLVRSDDVILMAIAKCVNHEITKFDFVWFAFAMTAGIQSDDIKALELFKNFLGPSVKPNACLIITRSETKTRTQRDKLRKQLTNDRRFEHLREYFGGGIFFTGAIDYDSYELAQTSIVDQFLIVYECREELFTLINKKIEPIHIEHTFVSEIRKLQEKHQKELKEAELAKERLLAEQNQSKRETDILVTNQRTIQLEYEKKMQEIEENWLEELKRIQKERSCTIS